MQKRVVSLVGSGLSSDLQALSHRRDVASLSLFYKYYYEKCSPELADLVSPKCGTVRSTRFSEQLILLCAGLILSIKLFSLHGSPWEFPVVEVTCHPLKFSGFELVRGDLYIKN